MLSYFLGGYENGRLTSREMFFVDKKREYEYFKDRIESIEEHYQEKALESLKMHYIRALVSFENEYDL